jgi:hypothetical protein
MLHLMTPILAYLSSLDRSLSVRIGGQADMFMLTVGFIYAVLRKAAENLVRILSRGYSDDMFKS